MLQGDLWKSYYLIIFPLQEWLFIFFGPLALIVTLVQCSVSSLMTTTEAIDTELPKDEKEGAATPGGMGGLDY